MNNPMKDIIIKMPPTKLTLHLEVKDKDTGEIKKYVLIGKSNGQKLTS